MEAFLRRLFGVAKKFWVFAPDIVQRWRCLLVECHLALLTGGNIGCFDTTYVVCLSYPLDQFPFIHTHGSYIHNISYGVKLYNTLNVYPFTPLFSFYLNGL